jgi:pimeloyl-ACP methyl ester carboxylesterase
MTRDAVIVVPGIMGSTLVEAESGKTLWGFDQAGSWVSAWTTGSTLERLAVTGDERAGVVGRVRPVGLLRFPAFAPILQGFEPYTDLVAGIGRVVADRGAVCEFAYDWRLSVEHNARELAKTVDWHLGRWRAHPKGSAGAKVVLVAHSMGGLIARYYTNVLGGADHVRTTVTLGTPYYGAVKAAHVLACGRGGPVPLPHRRLQRLAVTMPGLYDLLPFYRCVDEGTTARGFGAVDVADIGGDPGLAAESIDRHERLMSGPAGDLRLLVGTDQPTMQSMSLRHGVLEPLFHTCHIDEHGQVTGREDLAGDSTVFRRAAGAFGLSPGTLPQSHGGLAKSEEAVAHVRDVLTNDTAGPPLGVGGIGVDVPDVISLDTALTVTITGAVVAGTSCRVVEAFTGRQVARPPLLHKDGVTTASAELPGPGVYRVEVKGGGASAVTQQVMAIPPGVQMSEVD